MLRKSAVSLPEMAAVLTFFIYKHTTKEDLINDMTEDMKRQIVHNHYDERIVENNGEFFYSTEFGGINFDEPDSEMIITQ